MLANILEIKFHFYFYAFENIDERETKSWADGNVKYILIKPIMLILLKC